MAKQESIVDQISQSVAESVSSRIGLKPSTIEGSLEALLDIKNLLGKMIDPSKTVQQDQKFPFVFSKTFEKVLTNLKDTSTNFKAFSKDPNKRDSNVFFDAVSKIPSKIEEKISNKVKDVAYSFVPEAIKSKVLSFTGVEQEEKPEKEPVKDSSADIKVADQKQTEAVKPTEVTVDSAIPSLISKGFESVIEAINNKSIEIEPLEVNPETKAVEVKPLEVKPELKTVETKVDPKLNLPSIISKSVTNAIKDTKTKQEAPDILEKINKPTPILFAGFTDKGYAALKDKLPDMLSGILTNAKKDKEKNEKGVNFPGLGVISGALGVLSILGGIFTLLYGLQTEGPFKGLAKLAGKGMLEIGRILTKPLMSFISNISEFLLETPLKMIKSFGKSIGGLFGKVGSTVKVGIDKLISPITNVIKNVGERLIAVPMKLIKSFGKSIGELFGKVGGDVAKIGLGKLTEFLPKLLKGITSLLKKIPFIGSLISLGYAVSRFKSGDYVGGGIDILSGIASMFPVVGTGISIGLDALNAFLDMKTGGATGKQTGAKLDILGQMGKWIGEKIVKLPIIGPGIKAVQYLAAREWKKGLKQLALMNPIVDGISALLGDEDASDTAKAGAGLMQGINWSEIGTWMSQKLVNLPIIGPALKACQYFADGDFLKGIKQLAYIFPGFEMIGGLLGDTEAGSVSTAIGEWGFDLVKDLSKWIIDSLSEMINIGALKDKILGAASETWESRPTWMGGKGTPNPKDPAVPTTPTPTTTQPSQTTSAQNNTEGLPELAKGGIVTKPTKALIGEVGPEAIVPLEKLSSIAPVKEASNLKNKTTENNTSVSFSKAESILEKIANNTGATNGNMFGLIKGFNDLAQALKQSGTIKQAPVVVQQNPKIETDQLPAAEIAKQSTSPVSGYRGYVNFAEPQYV